MNLGLIQLSCGTRSGPHCKMYSKLICFRPCSSVRLTGQKHVENVEGESNIFNMLQRQHGNIICHICLQSYTLLPSFYLCQNTHWQFYKYQAIKISISSHFDFWWGFCKFETAIGCNCPTVDYEEYRELPQKACEGEFIHVIALWLFLEMPQNYCFQFRFLFGF